MGVPRPTARGDDGLGRRLNASEKDLAQLRRLIEHPKPAQASGGGALVYVQDEAPTDTQKGTLWYDTDAGV